MQELMASRRRKSLGDTGPAMEEELPKASLHWLLREPILFENLRKILVLLAEDEVFSALRPEQVQQILEAGLANFRSEEGQLLVMATATKGLDSRAVRRVLESCMAHIQELGEGSDHTEKGEGYLRIMRILAQEGASEDDFAVVLAGWAAIVGKLGVTSNFLCLIASIPSVKDTDLLCKCISHPIPNDQLARSAVFSLVSSCVAFSQSLPKAKLLEWSWSMVEEEDPYTRRKGLRNIRKLLKESDQLAEEAVRQGLCEVLAKKLHEDRVSLREDYIRVVKCIAKYVGDAAPLLEVADLGLNSEDSNTIDDSLDIVQMGLTWHPATFAAAFKAHPHFEYTLESLCYHKDSEISRKAARIQELLGGTIVPE